MASPPPTAYWDPPPVDPRYPRDGRTSLYGVAMPPQEANLQQAPYQYEPYVPNPPVADVTATPSGYSGPWYGKAVPAATTAPPVAPVAPVAPPSWEPSSEGRPRWGAVSRPRYVGVGSRGCLLPGALAHGQLTHLARESTCRGRPVAQWGIVFGVSGALQGVCDIGIALENLLGFHPVLGHVSLFQGDWRLPAILQQWAAHMVIYQLSGGNCIQIYSRGRWGGVIKPPGAEGSVTSVPRSAYSRGRVVFKAASNSSTSYTLANIDAKALGRYLRPSKARQAILRRLTRGNPTRRPLWRLGAPGEGRIPGRLP